MAMTRDEQRQLLPDFNAYHVDADAREAAAAIGEAAAAPAAGADAPAQHLASSARAKRARNSFTVFLKKRKGPRTKGCEGVKHYIMNHCELPAFRSSGKRAQFQQSGTFGVVARCEATSAFVAELL